tara:strand:- start:4289 stop:5095 length:807 start_codon:yes stop_codon:yes gene_type:complete
MPTTIPFTALGRGNGFPHCLDAVDVSGTNFHPLTLQQAMKAYWLFQQLNCTISSQLSAPTFNLFTSVTNIPLVDARNADIPGTSSSFEVLEPYERVCETPYFISDTTYTIDRQDPNVGTAFAATRVQIFSNIQKLYNGDVNDEDNFQGYGLEGSTTSGGAPSFRLYAYTGGFGGAVARVEMGSYMEGFGPDSGGNVNNAGTITLSIDGEDVNFAMRQRLRLTGLAGSVDKFYTFTDNGCEGKSVFTADSSTFQHCKVNITGFDVFTFN